MKTLAHINRGVASVDTSGVCNIQCLCFQYIVPVYGRVVEYKNMAHVLLQYVQSILQQYYDASAVCVLFTMTLTFPFIYIYPA